MTEYDEYYEKDEAPAPKKRRVVRPSADEHTTAEDPTEVADAAPAKKAPAKKAAVGSNGIRGGWTAGQAIMEAGSQYAQTLKLEAHDQVIKFLEDAPYANYQRHWVDRKGKTRPYVCLESVGKECPLCDIGFKPVSTAAFNVAVIGEDGGVLLKTWDVGPRIFNTLKGHSNDPKIGSLSNGYFTVRKTGQKKEAQTYILPVRESLLFELTGIEPASDEALATVGRYDADIIEVPSLKEMAELAAELSAGDDY